MDHAGTRRPRWFQHERHKSHAVPPILSLPLPGRMLLSRRYIVIIFLPVLAITLFLSGLHQRAPKIEVDLTVRWRNQEEQQHPPEDVLDVATPPPLRDEYDPSRYVQGPPTGSFKGELAGPVLFFSHRAGSPGAIFVPTPCAAFFPPALPVPVPAQPYPRTSW